MVTAERPTAAISESRAKASENRRVFFPLRLQLPPDWKLTNDLLLKIGALNDGWRLEADAQRGLLVMPPPGPLSSDRSGRIYAQTLIWSETSKRGRSFESSAMFELPNSERRMPDAAWISDDRLAGIDVNDEGIWEICPDFIVEVRSVSEELDDQQAKMKMWVSQGALLAWLVDPYEETVWIYRPAQEPKLLERPELLTANEIADDLTIDFSRIWPRQEPEPETS